MKRIRDGQSSELPNEFPFDRSLPQLQAQKDEHLIARVVPIPDKPHLAFEEAVHQAMLAGAVTMRTGDLLLDMAWGDTVSPHLDSDICNEAAEQLLELGQYPLLLTLAQQRHLHYRLYVGADPNRANVLAQIDDEWPHECSVYLTLSNELDGECAAALHEFLRRPCALDVHLDLEVDDDQISLDERKDRANAIAKALAQRPLREWLLHCTSDVLPEEIEVLHVVGAESIQLQYMQTTQDRQADDQMREEALCKVLRCATESLSLELSDLDDALALECLAAKVAWKHVVLRAENQAVLQQASQLDGGPMPRIEHLDIRGQGMLTLDAACVARLASHGIRMLTTHLLVDLGLLVTVKPTHRIDSLIACFIAKTGENLDTVLAAAHALDIVELRHLPTPVPPLAGYTHIDEATANRLTAISSAKLETHGKKMLEHDQAFVDAVTSIATWLEPRHSVSDLKWYFEHIVNLLIPAVPASAFDQLDPDSHQLQDKLQCCVIAGVPHDILKAAFSHFLDARPRDTLSVCRALIPLQGLLVSRHSARWHKLLTGELDRFRTPWLSDAMAYPDVKRSALLAEMSPPPLGQTPPQNVPTEPTNATVVLHDLVVPRGGKPALDAMIEIFDKQHANLLLQAQVDLISIRATSALRSWLRTGSIDLASLKPGVRNRLAHALLNEGQWKLLHHLIPQSNQWMLMPTSLAAAEAIAKMSTWPSPTSNCRFVLPSDFSKEAVEQVAKLARSVPTPCLSLVIKVGERQHPTFYDAAANLVRCKAGLRLGLGLHHDAGGIAPVDEIVRFLNGISETALASLGLSDIPDQEGLINALSKTIEKSKVDQLILSRCGPQLVNALAPLRHWKKLVVDITATAHDLFLSGAVSTSALSLQSRLPDCDPHWGGDMVGTCKALETVETTGAPVDAMAFVQGLERNPSVSKATAVLCTPLSTDKDGPHEELQALEQLRKNSSIRQLKLTTLKNWDEENVELSDETLDQMQQHAALNHFLSKLQSAIGAARGFGWSKLAGSGLVDALDEMGRQLDRRSMLALASTTKVAYLGMRRAWESEVEQLADLLDPAQTMSAVTDHLKKLIAGGSIAGPVPQPQDTKGTELPPKVIVMHQAGVPARAIQEAIGRRLLAPVVPESALGYLQALAYINAIAPGVWLETSMGIKPRSAERRGITARPLAEQIRI